jgi:1-acyl-sn-glycerol-3-phosphate acyltransferase
VDAGGHELPDRREGEVEFRGPSSTSGYLRNPRATGALISDGGGGWLRTGDRGFIADGEIFISGRSKDLIIRAGRHVFPYELEDVIGATPGVRRGGVAVFACPDPATGTERLVVVAETRATDAADRAELRARIESRAAAALESVPEDVVLVPPRTVPKTSSGKTRRAACRELYLAGHLGAERSVRRQIVALAAQAVLPLGRRALARIAATFYAAWFWSWFVIGLGAAWTAANLLPRAAVRRWVAAIARAFFAVVGVRLRLRGREQIPAGPSVLVFNHASYLDGMVLLALLPGASRFVVKGELGGSVLLRRALVRLGVEFVERFDPKRGIEDTARLEAAVRDGASLVVFPEGTNRRIPGLFPFRLGAFQIAARTRAPVVPGGIAGTRAVLRADQWFPRRAPVEVTMGAPLSADSEVHSETWEATLALRERARAEIANLAGEHLVE